jgi:GNAT superfamily N-acetyltransferase
VPTKDPILYALEPNLSPESFRDILIASTLDERRPAQDLTRLNTMLRQADIIVTARIDGKLVGISRAISDFSYCTYLSDLAVDAAHKGQGIGRRLIEETHRIAGPQTTLILLAAPKAETYYPHIGMKQFPATFIIPRSE